MLSLALLSGCMPMGGNHSSPGRIQHKMLMVVSVYVDNTPAEKLGLKVNFMLKMTADVTIKVKDPKTGLDVVKHGASVNDVDGRYPTTWSGYTPQFSEITYWSDSNPTSFFISGSISDTNLKTITAIGGLSVNAKIRIMCSMHKDGKLIPENLMSGIPSLTMTYNKFAATGKINMYTECTWTDHSTS